MAPTDENGPPTNLQAMNPIDRLWYLERTERDRVASLPERRLLLRWNRENDDPAWAALYAVGWSHRDILVEVEGSTGEITKGNEPLLMILSWVEKLCNLWVFEHINWGAVAEIWHERPAGCQNDTLNAIYGRRSRSDVPAEKA